MMWTCSCGSHHWAAQTVCPKCGRLAAGRPHRGVSNLGPSVQVPQVSQLQHQVPPQVPKIPQAPWFCLICETNNDQTNVSCMRCTYGHDKCRLASQESRRWMLKKFPPQWTCACGRQNMPAHQICTACTAPKPDTVLPSMCQPTRSSWRPQNAQPQQHVTNERAVNQLPRITPAGAPPRNPVMIPLASQGNPSALGPSPAQGSASGMHSSTSDERLLEVQTILAKELRQVIECDTQMDALAKQRAELLTSVLNNQSILFQMTVTQPSMGAQRKASNSPPKKLRRTDTQTSTPQAPLQTMTAHPFPPHPPTVQRRQGEAVQSISCCRRRQWQPVQPKGCH